MHRIEKSIFINAVPEKAQSYSRIAENWSKWFVNVSDIKIIKGHGEVGTVAEGVVKIWGMHFPVTMTVLEDTVTPEHVCTYITEMTGSITGKLTGFSVPKDGGVQVTFVLEYDIPGGVFGDVADTLVVHKLQENALVHTLENLKAIDEAK